MEEVDLHFFIDSTLNYFQEVASEKAFASIPYIKDDEAVMLEYTGIIGISGNKKGCIYLTTTGEMIKELAQVIIDTSDISTKVVKYLVGEIANTIAGNVREAYGSEFMISVPVIIEGRTKDLKLPADILSFVIPMNWSNHKCYLVVCLE